MSQKQTHEQLGYNGIYLERGGKDARELTDVLMRPPETPLTDVEKDEVLEFEADFLVRPLEQGSTIETAIRNHKGEDVLAPLFFGGAFVAGALQLDGHDIPSFQDTRSAYVWIAEQVRDQTVPVADLRALAQRSQDYYVARMTDTLLGEQGPADEEYDVMSLVVAPDQFIQSAAAAQQARSAALDARHDLSRHSPRLVDQAKRSVTDIYLGKLNTMIAGDIPIADSMMHQAQLIGDKEMEAAALEIMPRGLREVLNNDNAKHRMFRRLDYLRHGMGIGEAGAATTVDRSVQRAVSAETAQEVLFSAEDRERLKASQLSPETMQVIFSRVLDRAGLLSGEPHETWSPGRSKRAADNRFQVVINPTKRTFAVDGRSGVYKVPSHARSVYDVLVVGGAHELTHIDQAQADRRLGASIRIGELKGRRVSMLREAGANQNQRRVEQLMFGIEKPIALTYARALQALENGGTILDATRAFYAEKQAVTPGANLRDMAAEAADRVMRLVKSGGVNSQPMVYAEESILLDELAGSDAATQARATAITSLDLVDQVRLHTYGLLPVLDQETHDWTQYILEELEPYIQQALVRE